MLTKPLKGKGTQTLRMVLSMSRAMRKCVLCHPRSLISAFVVRCLDSIISLDPIAEIQDFS